MGEDAAILPRQNGVEAADQLAEIAGRHHVLGGLSRIFCLNVSPGHVRHVGSKPWVGLSELDSIPSDRVAAVLHAFQGAGVAAEVPEDIHAAIWSKFLFITAVGSVGAAARVPISELRIEPHTRRQLIDCMKEIETLAHHLGISLPDDIVSSTLETPRHDHGENVPRGCPQRELRSPG